MCAARAKWLASLKENINSNNKGNSSFDKNIAPPAASNNVLRERKTKVEEWLCALDNHPPAGSPCPTISEAGFQNFATTILPELETSPTSKSIEKQGNSPRKGGGASAAHSSPPSKMLRGQSHKVKKYNNCFTKSSSPKRKPKQLNKENFCNGVLEVLNAKRKLNYEMPQILRSPGAESPPVKMLAVSPGSECKIYNSGSESTLVKKKLNFDNLQVEKLGPNCRKYVNDKSGDSSGLVSVDLLEAQLTNDSLSTSDVPGKDTCIAVATTSPNEISTNRTESPKSPPSALAEGTSRSTPSTPPDQTSVKCVETSTPTPFPRFPTASSKGTASSTPSPAPHQLSVKCGETPTPSPRTFSASNKDSGFIPTPLPRRSPAISGRPSPLPRSPPVCSGDAACHATPTPAPRQKSVSSPENINLFTRFSSDASEGLKNNDSSLSIESCAPESQLSEPASGSRPESEISSLPKPSVFDDGQLNFIDPEDPLTLQSLKDLNGFLNECESHSPEKNDAENMRFVVYEDEVDTETPEEADQLATAEADAEPTVVVQNLQTEKPKITRKRSKNPSKQNKAKVALDKGLEHVNVEGKLISARVMKEPCNCRFKCSLKVSEKDRGSIFSGFWGLGDHSRQLDYLKDHTLVTKPAVHLTEAQQKQNTIKYFFVIDGQIKYVCKTMFLNTFGISESWTRTVLKKLKAQDIGHTIPHDMRGRHCKIPPETMKRNEENVMEHIRSFKPVPSHFCRAKSTRVYLDSSLNITKMWRLYKDWMKKEKGGQEVKSEKFYRRVFNTKFNIGFHQPKKDLCDFCTVYSLSSTAQKAGMQDKYDLHLLHKANAKKARKEDEKYAKQNKETVCYAIFDLQKVLSVPKLDTGMVYYKRKLSMYNFTIYDVIEHKGFCYTWNESEAARGANEIATCILQFISMMVQLNVNEFIFWSDNCGGQNKNKYLFSMYSHASARFKIKITHRYMEKGHTMNEADSMHATIERAAKNVQIYEPEDWIRVIENAKVGGHRYEVSAVGAAIIDFHTLADSHQNWKHNTAKWKTVREFQIDSSNPNQVMLRHDLSVNSQVTVVKISKVGRPVNLANYTFQKAFEWPIALPPLKLKDLASLCNELVIPSVNHGFYKQLRNFPDLTNPLLDLEDDAEVEEHHAPDRDFTWSDDSDESDYEEAATRLRQSSAMPKPGGDESNEDADDLSD